MWGKWVNFRFCFDISSMCFFCGLKASQSKCLPINNNPRRVFSGVFSEGRAKEFCCVMLSCLSYVLVVLRPSCFSKISKAVVKPISVNMINVSTRPIAMNYHPRKSVSGILSPLNTNKKVTVTTDTADSISGFVAPSISSGYGSGENASFWAVVQKFTNSIRRNICRIFNSHDAPPVRFDQGRAALVARVSPCHINISE